MPNAALNPLALAALVVHLWLPLLAVAVMITQFVSYVLSGALWMQWFLRQGQHHPFQAVGYVASAIVFISGVIIQYVWR